MLDLLVGPGTDHEAHVAADVGRHAALRRQRPGLPGAERQDRAGHGRRQTEGQQAGDERAAGDLPAMNASANSDVRRSRCRLIGISHPFRLEPARRLGSACCGCPAQFQLKSLRARYRIVSRWSSSCRQRVSSSHALAHRTVRAPRGTTHAPGTRSLLPAQRERTGMRWLSTHASRSTSKIVLHAQELDSGAGPMHNGRTAGIQRSERGRRSCATNWLCGPRPRRSIC